MGVQVYWVLFFITDNQEIHDVYWVLFFITDNRIPYMGVHVYWVLFFITETKFRPLNMGGVHVYWVLYFITDNQEIHHGCPCVLGFIFYY